MAKNWFSIYQLLGLTQVENNNQHLNILVDSRSIEKNLSNFHSAILAFLSHRETKAFRFMRSPYDAKDENLANIRYFELEIKPDTDTIIRIKTNYHGKHEWRIFFSFEMSDVEEFTKKTFKNDLPTEEDKEAILLVLVHRDLILGRFYDGASILVTENKKILRNRVWLQLHLSPKLKIMTVQEAIEIMDLYAKTRGQYYIRPSVTSDKKAWYWFSFRSKVPHYCVPNRGPFESRNVLEAFASRFTYLLMSIDEIGIHCLWLKDKDIMIPYHFNYFVSLVTGIFDSLAITTKEKYQIKLSYNHPSRISLLNSTGRYFLKELKKYNPDLRNHIDNYREFINLVYELREISLHREGFGDIGYIRDTGFEWYFKINDKIESMIKRFALSRNEPLSNWGIIKDSMFTLLEPFRFVNSAGKKLALLSDEYLRLLGFSKFVDTEIKLFEQYSLGSR